MEVHSQGHSGANRFKDPLDPRNEELVNAMSEVDRLRPDYVVFENVRGFTSTRNDGTFTCDTSLGSFADMAIALLVAIGWVHPAYTA
jgi:site-specific DNA-cytosine methylase